MGGESVAGAYYTAQADFELMAVSKHWLPSVGIEGINHHVKLKFFFIWHLLGKVFPDHSKI